MFLENIIRRSVGRTQVNEKLRVKKNTYNELLDDEDILVGFELEIEVPADRDLEDIAGELQSTVQDIIHVRKTNDEIGQNKDIDSWYLEYDSTSIDVNHGIEDINDVRANNYQDLIGKTTIAELVSPPMSLKQVLSYIERLFDYVDNSFYLSTTEATGFHVSMSYKSNDFTRDNIDPLKVLILIGEKNILEEFERTNNTFTASLLERLKKLVLDDKELFLHNQSIQDFQNTLYELSTHYVPKEKQSSINFSKLHNQGYVEFRMIGGEGYHTRFDQIKNFIMKYAYVLKAGCDKDAFKGEYLMKVYSFLHKTLEPGMNIENDPIFRKYRFAMPEDLMKSFRHYLHYVNAMKESEINRSSAIYKQHKDIAYDAFTYLVPELYHSNYEYYDDIVVDMIRYHRIRWFFVQQSLRRNKFKIEDFMDILPHDTFDYLK